MKLFTLPGDLTVQKLKGLIQRLFKIDFSDQVLSYVSQKVVYHMCNCTVHAYIICLCAIVICVVVYVVVSMLIFVTLLFVALLFLYDCLYCLCVNICGIVVCNIVAVYCIIGVRGIVVICVLFVS